MPLTDQQAYGAEARTGQQPTGSYVLIKHNSATGHYVLIKPNWRAAQ